MSWCGMKRALPSNCMLLDLKSSLALIIFSILLNISYRCKYIIKNQLRQHLIGLSSIFSTEQRGKWLHAFVSVLDFIVCHKLKVPVFCGMERGRQTWSCCSLVMRCLWQCVRPALIRDCNRWKLWKHCCRCPVVDSACLSSLPQRKSGCCQHWSLLSSTSALGPAARRTRTV